MNMPLTTKQREELATEIFNWLVEHDMWVDVCIYFNGKCWSTSNQNNTEFCYNENRYFEYETEPNRYFEYVRNPNILSMSFEGYLYSVLNGYVPSWYELQQEFRSIFDKYGVYYELGNAWNLTCFD